MIITDDGQVRSPQYFSSIRIDRLAVEWTIISLSKLKGMLRDCTKRKGVEFIPGCNSALVIGNCFAHG